MGQRIPVTLGNIAPLAVKPFRPGKLVLVCEGGGQRQASWRWYAKVEDSEGFLLPGCWTNLCAPDLTPLT